jgi:Protein of unknown function (DUF4232)
VGDEKVMESGNRWVKRLASAAGLATAAVALAACQQQVSASGSATVVASASAHVAQSSSSAAAQPSTGATQPAPAASSPCSTTNLLVSLGKPAGTGTALQYRVSVTLRNNGPSTCNLDGYPGIDLVGDGGDMKMPVPRESETYSPVTLKPGQDASFTLTYALEDIQEVQGELGAWGPNSIVITSPNSVSHQTLPWPFGPVVTTPSSLGRGTYLSPVGS